jgi:acetate kinase
MRILVLNAGSSTFKWTVLDGEGVTLQAGSGDWASAGLEGRAEEVRTVLRGISAIDAVGHRVVHGGTRFVGATIVDAAVRKELEALVELDRLHMLPALAGIDAVSAEFPDVTQVAAFDTAFHAGMPEAAAGYALPFEWSERWGLRRFGFHGLSVQYSVEQARRILGGIPARMIVCHLGSGCSITAVADGKSIDTTMGFSPLEGVMMATRSGSVDPGLLLYLQERCGLGVAELRDGLANRSGLLGVSGVSADLRQVLAAEAHSPRARTAYQQFIWTLKRAVGSMAGVLGGIDAVVFTGGIGENSARVRGDVSAALGFAGLVLASETTEPKSDRLISSDDSRVAALLIRAREDLVVLGEVLRIRQSLD